MMDFENVEALELALQRMREGKPIVVRDAVHHDRRVVALELVPAEGDAAADQLLGLGRSGKGINAGAEDDAGDRSRHKGTEETHALAHWPPGPSELRSRRWVLIEPELGREPDRVDRAASSFLRQQ